MSVKLLFFMILITVFSSCNKKHIVDENRTVYIKKIKKGHYELVKNNKPFYIRGAAGKSYFKELSKIGGNTIRVYDTINLGKVLNNASEANLSVIVDLPIPRFHEEYNFYTNPISRDTLITNIKRTIKKYKDHPSLLMWMLGNEIEYPYGNIDKNFVKTFNELIETIRKIDPNHPISTTIDAVEKKRILSITRNSPGIDLISINIFGNIRNLDKELSKISLFWNGPFLISEWGIEGPWTDNLTLWKAPIEPASSLKAEQYAERYNKYVKNTNKRCLGNLIFYWGQKQERTHTWFSLFSEKGSKSQTIYEMEKIWTGKYSENLPPKLVNVLLDGKDDKKNTIFKPNEIKTAKVIHNNKSEDSIYIKWEIMPDSWANKRWDVEEKVNPIKDIIKETKGNSLQFLTPNEDGPYRLYVYLYDKHNNFSTVNAPFYVLSHNNEHQNRY